MYKQLCVVLFWLGVQTSAFAQCSGSLGAPIINETFGSGSSQFAPPLPPGTTTMGYSVNQCPLDGYYTITNYTTGCFQEWHTLHDHTGEATGDTTGYFMLIDASFQPSVFFTQTVNGLCDGTTYQFGAWIINMFQITGGIDPNITFTIEKADGTVLASYDTGDINITLPAKWQQYSFYFKTPPGINSVVLVMRNNAPGGQGNDLALDDITFTPAGPKTTIAVSGATSDFYETNCSDKITLSSTVESCYTKNGYQWQASTDGTNFNDIAGANSLNYTPNLSAPGIYYYRLNVAESDNIGNPNCSAFSNIFTLNYVLPARQSLAAAICAGQSYAMPSGKKINNEGTYLDTVRNYYGCDSLISTVSLKVLALTYTTVNAAICQGQNYSGHTTSGTYVDTLKAANGCDSIRTVNLTVETESHTTINPGICKGENFLDFTKTGTYMDTLKAANGCDSIVTINLTVNPSFTLGPDRTICGGDTILLNPGSFSQYLWQDHSTGPDLLVTRPGTYWVKVTDQNGCSATDTVNIRIGPCPIMGIPNTFTPNGDGVNDTWKINALLGYPGCNVFIYNRWGQPVYKSVGYNIPWDGTLNGKNLPVGTYYYVIDLKNNTPPVSGFVTIIR